MIFLYQLFLGRTFQASLSHALMAIGFMGLIYAFPMISYPLAKCSLVNSLAYFLGDLTLRFNWPKLIHHCVAITGILITFFTPAEVSIYVAVGSGILEFSGPWWTFLRIRLEHSPEIVLPRWYDRTVAGTIFMIVFFLDRFVWFNYYVLYETPAILSNGLVNLIFIPFTLLHIYWFILIVRGFLKEIRKRV